MRIIIIDGFHKGHVIDVPNPSPTIKLVKPKTITVCDCDEPDLSRFDYDAGEVTYECAFKSLDGNVALFSEKGDSLSIFDSGFEQVWHEKPWNKNETLHFGCHDYHSWK